MENFLCTLNSEYPSQKLLNSLVSSSRPPFITSRPKSTAAAADAAAFPPRNTQPSSLAHPSISIPTRSAQVKLWLFEKLVSRLIP